MHELSVTQEILDIAVRQAQAVQAERVTDLYIVIGELSSFVDDSIAFYWDLLADGSPCAGAALHFDRRPAQLKCCDCSSIYGLADGLRTCPVCGSSCIEILQGEEFFLESITVEKSAQMEAV